MIFKRNIWVLVSALALCLAFTACSSEPDVKSLNGRWGLDKAAITNGKDVTGKNIEISMKVSEDGKAVDLTLVLTREDDSKEKFISAKCEKVNEKTYLIRGEKKIPPC